MERSLEDSIKNKTYIDNLRSAAKYSKEVIDLVEADIEYGLTMEQTKLYLKREIKFPQMKLLSQCLRKGADEAFIELLTKYDMSGYQIQVAIEFMEKGISMENIETVIAKGENPLAMRKSFQTMLDKVKQIQANSDVSPDYVKGLVKQIEEAVAKIQFQEERYDELNKKLKVFENSKKDEEVHKGLVKKLEDTEAELSGQQDQLNRANATIARLREQIDEKEKEMEKMQNRIDTLEDKLLEKAAGATVKQEAPEKPEESKEPLGNQTVFDEKPVAERPYQIPVFYQLPVVDANGRVSQIENLLVSIEMYRIEEEKAINRLAEVLTAYGVDVTEEQVRRADAEEIKEKVNESRSRREEEDEETKEEEQSEQYAPKCTLREPVL